MANNVATVQAKRDPTPFATWAGYEDYRNRRPFRPSYEKMHWLEQLNYETSRLFAANISSTGTILPVWPAPLYKLTALQVRQGLCYPLEIAQLINAAVYSSGNPNPPRRAKADQPAHIEKASRLPSGGSVGALPSLADLGL